jgi:hypothetical protein
MTDTVDDVIRDFNTAVARELASACERLRAATRAPAPVVIDPVLQEFNDLILPGAAVHLSGLSRAQVHRLCRRYPIGEPSGFAVWMAEEDRWLLSKSRFELFLKLRPRRKRDAMRRKTGAKETL